LRGFFFSLLHRRLREQFIPQVSSIDSDSEAAQTVSVCATDADWFLERRTKL
jgi:hypothetical protein